MRKGWEDGGREKKRCKCFEWVKRKAEIVVKGKNEKSRQGQ